MGVQGSPGQPAAEESLSSEQIADSTGQPTEDPGQENAPKSTETEKDEFGLPLRRFKPPPDSYESSDDGYESAVENDSIPDQTSAKKEQASISNGESLPTEHQEPSPDLANGEEKIAGSEGVLPPPVPRTPSPRTKAEELDNVSELNDTVSPVRNPKDGRRGSNPDWSRHSKKLSISEQMVLPEHLDAPMASGGASEWSHQLVVPRKRDSKDAGQEEAEWQEMPAFASHDIYDDDGKLVAREVRESDDEAAVYGGRGGAGKGYTKVNVDDDAQSASSMDENTRYLFKEGGGTHVIDEDDDEAARDPLSQLQATKDLLTEQQRIAYVALVRVSIVTILNEVEEIQSSRTTKKELRLLTESTKMWGQKMMVRLYAHMDVSTEGKASLPRNETGEPR